MIKPQCDECFIDFDTRWNIDEVTEHFNEHIAELNEMIKERDETIGELEK